MIEGMRKSLLVGKKEIHNWGVYSSHLIKLLPVCLE